MDSADKATNKAMSAAYKYACLQVFCIPTEGMAEDADATTHKVAPVAPPPPKTAAAVKPPAPPKPWGNIAGMIREFAKVESLLPPDMYFTILSKFNVHKAEDFRRGPTTSLTENSSLALACYTQLLHAAAEYQSRQQDPTTYENFQATEGEEEWGQ